MNTYFAEVIFCTNSSLVSLTEHSFSMGRIYV